MKKIIFFIFPILVLVITGCELFDETPAPTLEIQSPTGTIPYGSSTSFSWVAKGEITSVTIDDIIVKVSGLYYTPKLYKSQSYVIKATGSGGVVSETVKIIVDKAVAPTLTVTIVNDSIPYGGIATFSWVAEGEITSVTLDNNVVPNTGSYTNPVLNESKEYTLVAKGPGGSSTEKISIYVYPAVAPTLTVTVPKDSIPYGSKATFSWITEGNLTSVTLDGNSVPRTGWYTTEALYKSKEYTMVVIGPAGSVTQKVTILVGNWETSNFGLITHDYFLLKEIRYIQDEWSYYWILSEDKKTDKYYFYDNYTLRVYDINGKSAGGPFNWSLPDETHLKEGDQVYSIVISNKKFLILRKESQYNDRPAILEKTYHRPWL